MIRGIAKRREERLFRLKYIYIISVLVDGNTKANCWYSDIDCYNTFNTFARNLSTIVVLSIFFCFELYKFCI